MARLRRYLTEVVLPFSAFHRKRLAEAGVEVDRLRRFADMDRIPFMSKPDLVTTPAQPDRARELVLQPDPAVLRGRPGVIFEALTRGRAAVERRVEEEYRPIFLTSTTGRSADPVSFLFSRWDLEALGVAGRRIMEVAGGARTDRMVNLFPYAPHLAFWQAHYAGVEFGAFMAGTGGGKVMGTSGCIRFLKKVDPDVVIGMPTFLYHVLKQGADEGLRCAKLKKIVLGGEKVEEGTRRKLRQLARALGAGDIDVVATYGFTEAKMAFVECPGIDSGYHTYPDYGLWELVNPATGLHLEEGPGEIVYTPLAARGTVVMRYRTGDQLDGRIAYEPCPHCGRVVPRLVGRISRVSEVREMRLEKIKGTLVDFNELEHVLDDVDGVGCWQIELRKVRDDPMEVDELILHVEPADRVDGARLKVELSRLLLERTEVRPNEIQFHTAREMQELQGVGVQLKEARLVDYRARDGFVCPPRKGTPLERGVIQVPPARGGWLSRVGHWLFGGHTRHETPQVSTGLDPSPGHAPHGTSSNGNSPNNTNTTPEVRS